MITHTNQFVAQPRENEVRVIERDGERWLQQYRMPPLGFVHERAWVDIGQLPQPLSNLRALAGRGR